MRATNGFSKSDYAKNSVTTIFVLAAKNALAQGTMEYYEIFLPS